LVELRDVFKFSPYSPSTTTKTKYRTPPRASFFSFSFRRKPPDEALFRIRFTYFAKRTRVASGQIIPRFVESGAPFRRRRRRIDAVSYSIANLAPKDVLFRKVRVFSSKKRPKKEKKRTFSRFFSSFLPFYDDARRAPAVFSSFGVKLAVAAATLFAPANANKKSVAQPAQNARRSTDSPRNAPSEAAALFA
jgi:hypothetical protein